MVTAGKIYRIPETTPLEELATRLEGYRREEEYQEEEYKFTLVTEISNLKPVENSLTGLYSHDYITHALHRGKVIPRPRTISALFFFKQHENRTLLTVLEKKKRANYIANQLSKIIYGKAGHIVEARIPPETLKAFHIKNPESTKVTFFDNVDIPNVNKLSLYGSDLIDTPLFEEYSKHGDIWYIIVKSKEEGYVVGITRNASITIFNTDDKSKYLDYVEKKIYPLII